MNFRYKMNFTRSTNAIRAFTSYTYFLEPTLHGTEVAIELLPRGSHLLVVLNVVCEHYMYVISKYPHKFYLPI